MSHQVQTNARHVEEEAVAAWINAHVDPAFVVKFTDEFKALGGESLDHLVHLQDEELKNIGMPLLKRRKLLHTMSNLPGNLA
jgi:hypothetical protein